VDEPVLERTAAMRYMGQNYEVEVALPPGEIDDEGWHELLARFEAEHDRQFGFALPDETVEIINLRVTALRLDPRPQTTVAPPSHAIPSSRPVWFGADGPVTCPVVRRDALSPGEELEGPLVIEEPDSTTLVHPGDRVRVDDQGVLTIALGGTP